MDEDFELPVTHKGAELMLPARLQQSGYTHRFEVMVNDVPVLFEPDEEGSYRALVDAENSMDKMDAGLFEAIATAIENVVK